MEIKSVSFGIVDFNLLKPEKVFEWLEEFGFKRYACQYYVKPSERRDKRYPAEQDKSPEGWYTHIGVPQNYFDNDKTLFIIDAEMLNKIKKVFEHKIRLGIESDEK